MGDKISGGDRLDQAEGKKLETWIRDKYINKKFAPKGLDPPHVRLARGESVASPRASSVDGSEKKKKKDKKEKKDKDARDRSSSPAPHQVGSFSEAFADVTGWALEEPRGRRTGSPQADMGKDKKDKK